MNSPRRTFPFGLLAAMAFCLALSVSANSQVKTETNTTTGSATTEVKVERGEVVSVNGNDLIVKMEDGSLRHFANVPESARVTVEGKELGIHDLKPGMKLERTITTTTMPKTITTVQTVTGTVWQVMPPNSVTLRLADNTTQRFKIPKGQKFTVNGQETDAWGLRQGMKISATKVVEEPGTVVEEQRRVTGTMPPPPTPPPPDQPILIAVVHVPPPAPAAESTANQKPAALPKTGGELPLVGLLGVSALAMGLALRAVRLMAR
jgi:RNase P/RNase MRP subunit p29